MLGRQARALSKADQARLLRAASSGPTAGRDQLIVLLAVYAGLRACEITRLTWDMVLDANGRVARTIDVRSAIAKRGAGRRVPTHPTLHRALSRWLVRQDTRRLSRSDAVISSRYGRPLKPNTLVNWFTVKCREAGLEGCSSHSGRRTFITRAARQAHRAGANLRDVQMLAGHRSIETTQGYIDGDTQAQRRLVRCL